MLRLSPDLDLGSRTMPLDDVLVDRSGESKINLQNCSNWNRDAAKCNDHVFRMFHG